MKVRYTPEQADVLDYMVENDGIVLVNAIGGSGKEQPLTSKILTPDGWVAMGDIKVGDKVCTPTKSTNTVLAIHPQGIKDVYKVTFSDNTSAECGLNHLWHVTTNQWRPNNTYKQLSTKELMQYELRYKGKNGYRFKVPLTEVELPTKELPLDPYLLGALIADGSFHAQVCLSSHIDDMSIIEKCIKLLPEGTSEGQLRNTSENGIQQTFRHTGNKKGDHSLKSILKDLELQGLYSHEKFIPDMYKFSDYDQRVSLLRGLMDCDGYAGSRNRVSYSTTSKRLAEDITTLVQSLGGLTSINSDERKGRRDCYQVSIKFNTLNPFSLLRKANRVTPRTAIIVRKAIVAIEKLEKSVEQQCISVAGDNLYITDGFITTHNSFMARQAVKELSVKSGIYTAFNKSIVKEMEDKFRGTPIECRTLHALAYKYVKPKLPIKSFSYKCITEKITYTEKRKIIDSLDEFFVSGSTCMYDYFSDKFKKHPRMKFMTDLAVKYVDLMAEGRISPTFNFLLKSLHLMLVEGTVKIKVDIMILDECQDSTAIALEIFKLVDAPKKLGLGDADQAIYQFLNLVNGFEVLKKESTLLRLTNSFRCSREIAKRIERGMEGLLDESFEFKGTDNPCTNGNELYVTLTNSSIVDRIQERLEEGRSFTLLRNPSDIFATPLAVLSASQGKTPYQSKFAFLVDLYDDFNKQDKHGTYAAFLLAELDDDEINGAIRMLAKLRAKGINLFTLYADAKKAIPDPQYTISTVFCAKGMEYQTVRVATDLESKFEKACNGELNDEDTTTVNRLMYVACSRAGKYLYTNSI